MADQKKKPEAKQPVKPVAVKKPSPEDVKVAQSVLASVATAEQAHKLTGEERSKYLKALDVVHGPKEERTKGRIDGYHGTTATGKPFDKMKTSNAKSGQLFGQGVYMTTNPEVASTYADKLDEHSGVPIEEESGAVYPLSADPGKVFDMRTGEFDPKVKEELKKHVDKKYHKQIDQIEDNYNLFTYAQEIASPKEISKAINKAGYNSVKIDDETYNVFAPKRVRSKHAAFDPRFQDSDLLLAAEGGVVPHFADGGMVPDGAVPVDQFQAALPQQTNVQTPTASGIAPDGAIPVDQFESSADKYGTDSQMGITALEGVAHGIAGPLATLAETKLLGVPEEDILGRQRENAITHGVGQGAGLAASMFMGTGEARVMAKGAELAAGAVGLGKLAEGASLGARVGSEAVKQAAEMAILTSGDEVSKMILHDPEQTAETALSNVGLGTAFGAAGGAFMEGAVSPLWKATVGPKLEEGLQAVASKFNDRLHLPEHVAQAAQNLDVEVSPVLKSALSGNEQALASARELYRARNPAFMEQLTNLNDQTKAAVEKSFGFPLDDVVVFSDHRDGQALHSKAAELLNTEYEKLKPRLEADAAELKTIRGTDDSRIDLAGGVMDRAVSEAVGTDSPVFHIYETYANKVLSRETMSSMDALRSELGTLARDKTSSDLEKMAYSDIRNKVTEYIDKQVSSQAKEAGESMLGASGKGTIGDDVAKLAGREEGKELGAELLNRASDTKRDYKEYVERFEQIMDHLGIGDWKGTGKFLDKLDSLTPETLLKKFTTKGDVGGAEMLSKEFPELAQMVKDYEAKKFMSGAVHVVDDKATINLGTLERKIAALKKGQPEHLDWVLPKDVQEKIASAKILNDNMHKITGIKDSGTPKGMAELLRHFGSSALGAIGYLTGHGAIGSALLGEIATRMAKDAPEAIKMGMLKFMGSDQPVKAEGFKAMVDYMQAAAKGETALTKAAQAVFKAGAQVAATPDIRANEKLDKQVSAFQNHPDKMLEMTKGHVGHYMPDHQTALAAAGTRAIQYLQSIKPQPHKLGPLDKEVPPTPVEVQRYERALTIANQPNIILQHVKQGTLLISDIQDLNGMYPALYNQMVTKLTSEMTQSHAAGETIPYKTRMGLSLLMGTPVDASMNPMAIQAAQMTHKGPGGPPQGAAQGGGKPTQKSGNALNKLAKSYQTPGQTAQADRANRD